jgi:hypothetical protein
MTTDAIAPVKQIEGLILQVRGQQVISDVDLAAV